MKCPRCHVEMLKRRLQAADGVVVDWVCPACGYETAETNGEAKEIE